MDTPQGRNSQESSSKELALFFWAALKQAAAFLDFCALLVVGHYR